MSDVKFVAVTACPTGIAHTYMAAEKLEQAAQAAGHEMKVETQGSIGVENELTEAEIAAADAVVIAADKAVDLDRFAGKRVIVAPVSDGISGPGELMEQALSAPVQRGADSASAKSGGKQRGPVYTALMNGVSFMIPFVVTGGLMIAMALAVAGEQVEGQGLVIPEGSIWASVLAVGAVGFKLMIPILSGYIAYAIADRPGLAPGMIAGWVAADGAFYGSESGAGFLGAIVTGFAAGYFAKWIKGIKVPKFVAPIMPIIVIPLVTTIVVCGLFIKVVGPPVAWIFAELTNWLSGMTGASAVVLGLILGAMIAIDMGGPINKTAFLFGAAMIPTNPQIMGIVSVAICIPPIGMGLATLIRKKLFNEQEREAGMAAMFMGFFGITEGAIPFAAADPARVIPANVLGGAVGGALAGLFGVTGVVPHGGFIVVLLGAIGAVLGWLAAATVGILITAFTAVALKSRAGFADDDETEPETPIEHRAEPAAATTSTSVKPISATASKTGGVATLERTGLLSYISEDSIDTQLDAASKEQAIDKLIDLLSAQDTITDKKVLRTAVMDRESLMTTGIGEGIAMPHGKTRAVSRAGVAFAKAPAGIDWGALDGEPAHLLFLITAPEQADGDEHLRILAMLSRKLVDPDFKERLMGATSPGEVMTVLEEVG
ncbi:MAG: fructose-specific PTS transporter subunit EIIC [Candidatus Nanopelagicales bacterium]